MSELEYDTNFATWLTAAGITPSATPINIRGVVHQILQNLQGAPSPSVTTPTLGAAAQLAQTTMRATIYIDVTAGGNLVVAIGPTVGVASTIFSGTSPIQMMTVVLPPGWFIAVTTSGATTWTAVVLNGI